MIFVIINNMIEHIKNHLPTYKPCVDCSRLLFALGLGYVWIIFPGNAWWMRKYYWNKHTLQKKNNPNCKRANIVKIIYCNRIEKRLPDEFNRNVVYNV